jgi:ribosomal protein L40E
MAAYYWYPVSQTYVPGNWRGVDWLVAFVALIFLVGILILAYMIAARPAGELVVIYEYRPPAPAPAASPTLVEADGKICPRCAETVKSAAVVCRYCGHEFGSRASTG